MIPEITIKISFAEAPGGGGGVTVTAASGGVEIAPPEVQGEAAPAMIPAPPEMTDAGSAGSFDPLPPPPGGPDEDEPGGGSDEDTPPPSPRKGAKRGR